MKMRRGKGSSAFSSLALEFIERRIRPRTVNLNGISLATIVPASPLYQFDSKWVQKDLRYVLSRFTYCRRVDQDFIVESPLSHAYLVLHDHRAILVLFELIQPQRIEDIAERVPGITKKTAFELFQLLYNAGALSGVNKKSEPLEDYDKSLLQWEFHDLLFHSRSRTGRHSNPFGRTDHFVGKVEAPPVVKPKMSKNKTDLFRPDINKLRHSDLPFTRVVEDRRSRRKPFDPPITGQELGEFLYRSARVRGIYSTSGFGFTDRLYPGSGAAYELELYIAINRCHGIASGLYHYSPLDHQLFRLSGQTRAVKELLQCAADTAHTSMPQLLIIISARFQRMSWRYESISYSAILKDVGVLYQTFYLVATAMGLSACALGVGDSDLFSKAANTNYYVESSVGEFIIGR